MPQLERQFGRPLQHSPTLGYSIWQIEDGSVEVSRAKLAISEEEIAERRRERLKENLSEYEWSVAAGHLKWVTIQVQHPPSSFQRALNRLQDFVHF